METAAVVVVIVDDVAAVTDEVAAVTGEVVVVETVVELVNDDVFDDEVIVDEFVGDGVDVVEKVVDQYLYLIES
jgi:hypothetical protein